MFTQEDFTSMRYRVDLLSEKQDPLEVFKEFKFFNEFVNPELPEKVSFNKVFRYIGYLYQPHSPLKRIFADVLKRKVEAAKLADFDMNKEKRFTKEYQDIINDKYECINAMIIRFIRTFKNIEMAELSIYEEEYYKELLALKNESEATDKKNRMINIETIGGRIKKLLGDITYDDANHLLIEKLLDDLENEQLNLRPEDIALKIRRKEDPLLGFNPRDLIKKRNKELAKTK